MSTSELLGQFVSRYATSPLVLGRRIEELSRADAGEFQAAAAEVLRGSDGTRGYQHLIRVLSQRNCLQLVLLRLAKIDVEAMARITRDLIAGDPLFDVLQLVRDLKGPGGAPASEQARADLLGALGVACQNTRLFPIISGMLKGTDPRFNSQAVLTIGKAAAAVAADFLIRQTEDPDPRVCANAIEGLWGEESPRVIELYQRMKKRAHQRIVANALVGLYRAGHLDGLTGLAEMAHHPSNAFRVSAAWAMGALADPRFVPTLKRLMKEPPGAVGQQTLRALQKIQAARQSAAAVGEGVLPVFKCQQQESGVVEAVLGAWGRRPRLLPQIRPVEWSIETGGKEPLFDFEVEAFVSPPMRLAVLAPLPQEGDTARFECVEEALELALSLKRPQDGYVLLPYRTSWKEHPGDGQAGQAVEVKELDGPEAFWRPWRDPDVRDQTCGPLPNVTQLALEIVQRHKGPRHILLVVDGTTPDRPLPEQLQQTLERLGPHHVTAHVVLLSDPDRELEPLLAPLVEQSGGVLLTGGQPVNLPDLLAGVSSAQALRYALRFKPPAPEPGAVATPLVLSYQTADVTGSAILTLARSPRHVAA